MASETPLGVSRTSGWPSLAVAMLSASTRRPTVSYVGVRCPYRGDDQPRRLAAGPRWDTTPRGRQDLAIRLFAERSLRGAHRPEWGSRDGVSLGHELGEKRFPGKPNSDCSAWMARRRQLGLLAYATARSDVKRQGWGAHDASHRHHDTPPRRASAISRRTRARHAK